MWQFWCWKEYIDTGEISTDVNIHVYIYARNGPCIYSILSKSIYLSYAVMFLFITYL